MKSNVEVENKMYTLYIVLFLLALYTGEFVASFTGDAGKISILQIGNLTIPSAGLFIVVCGLAVWKRYFYFLFLVFVVLAFPAPVDDLFPSVTLTTNQDRDQVAFPLITRIDLYLILGILLKLSDRSFRIPVIRVPIFFKLVILGYVAVMLINIVKSADVWDFNLLLGYSFHIRYALLIILLLSLYDVFAYQKLFMAGIFISVSFLLLESLINTYAQGAERLLSGSLSLNTFANITAAIALYYIYLLRYRAVVFWVGFMALILSALIIVGSGTRGALLTLLISWLLLHLFTNYKRVAINLLKGLSGVLLLLSVYWGANQKGWIPERYSYEYLSKRVNIDWREERLSDIFEIKRTRETSSIKSRLDLFDASVSMIGEHPLTGIGAGRWNRYKNNYSADNNIPNVLLDTHNDYLALMSQYGVILGLAMAWGIFFRPFYLLRGLTQRVNVRRNPLFLLYVINFSMGIAALSNAGVFKHQVAAFLLLNVCISQKFYNEYWHGD